MDGNGRWAQARGLTRSQGHEAGAENVYTIVHECRRLGIDYLSLYAFSKENWNRPAAEIQALFRLMTTFLTRFLPLMQEQGIRLNILGDVEALPLSERGLLKYTCEATNANTAMMLNLAINYGGRAELVEAFKKIQDKGLSQITEETIAEHLYTKGQPDPDLLIRTSGEQRLSNFLLFQCAYTEFYFTHVYWPDFDVAELHKALEAYRVRKRRFGKTQEQVTP